MANNTTATTMTTDGGQAVMQAYSYINQLLSYPTYKLIPGMSEPIYPLVGEVVPIGLVITILAILWMFDDFRKPVTNEAEDVWVRLNK